MPAYSPTQSQSLLLKKWSEWEKISQKNIIKMIKSHTCEETTSFWYDFKHFVMTTVWFSKDKHSQIKVKNNNIWEYDFCRNQVSTWCKKYFKPKVRNLKNVFKKADQTCRTMDSI